MEKISLALDKFIFLSEKTVIAISYSLIFFTVSVVTRSMFNPQIVKSWLIDMLIKSSILYSLKSSNKKLRIDWGKSF